MRRDPPMHLVRRVAATPPDEQATIAVTLGELLYGAAKRGSPSLAARVRDLVTSALFVLPFDDRLLRSTGP